MLIFKWAADSYRFVHVGGRVVVNPFPATGIVSVTNGTLFEGTRVGCEAEYERLGLEPLDNEVGTP